MTDADESVGEALQETEKEIPGAPALPRKQSGQSPVRDETKSMEADGAEQEEHGASTEAINDQQTDEAVDDIVRKEGDELLAAQDRTVAPQTVEKPKKRHWWTSGWFIWTLVFLVLGGGLATALIPASRYFILNTAGVRVGASVHVADSTTGQPLKNVTVKIGAAVVETDEQGNATLTQLKQGLQKLTIERVAFATLEKELVLGWGSNPLGTFKLSPSGAQYTLWVRDFLSKEPIAGAEVSSGRLSAVADEQGKAVLTIQQTDRDELPITVSASGYRTDNTTLPIDTADTVELLVVPSNKVVFVARAEGRYNLYSMYADGKDRKVLLGGTGREDANISLAVSQSGQTAALVSTRESIASEDGEFLQSLTIVNANDGNSQTIERALDIRLIDWVGDNLVYQITMPGLASNDPERQRLMSYNVKEEKRTRLAAASNLESVASAQGQLYYSAADGTLNKISPSGDTKEETVLDKAVTAAYRTDYDTLTLRAHDGWYRLALSSDDTLKIGTPDNPDNRVYIADQGGNRNLWINDTALMLYDIPSSEDKRLYNRSNLSYPVRWLGSVTAAYRAGSTDYIVSADGGDPRKITQVTNTSGLIQTY